jgi:hypothetical protein
MVRYKNKKINRIKNIKIRDKINIIKKEIIDLLIKIIIIIIEIIIKVTIRKEIIDLS